MKRTQWSAAWMLAATCAAGCGSHAMNGGEEAASTEALTTVTTTFGTTFQGGMKLSYDDIATPDGLALSSVVGLTACDRTSLFAVSSDPNPKAEFQFALSYSRDSGASWKRIAARAPGREVACDHSRLVSVGASRNAYIARVHEDGSLEAWTFQPSLTTPIDRLQGGDGEIYGISFGAAGTLSKVYLATNNSTSSSFVSWSGPIASVGATMVTGTGTKTTGLDLRPVGNTLDWSRRAFALEKDGSLSINDRLLDGKNTWTPLYTGSERFTVVTAAAPNLIYGLQIKAGEVHLTRITMSEISCADGIDNDADGLTDSEDEACVKPLATEFCKTHEDGAYCSDRYQPAIFLGQANQSTATLFCHGGRVTWYPGVCAHDPNPAVTHGDRHVPIEELTPADPPNTGHWCSIVWPDKTWAFDWEGDTPCDPHLIAKSGGTIARAGIYSKTGVNNVLVDCRYQFKPLPFSAVGVTALEDASKAVAQSDNACVFNVSPASLPIFSKAFDAARMSPLPQTVLPFHHSVKPVDLAPFGNGATGFSIIDRTGAGVPGDFREGAYDFPLDEGTPLYALSGGVVIPNGSRERAISSSDHVGSSNQGELYVRYAVGKDSVYQESFVVYYAHVRKRLVTDNQTVKAGQIIGYSGATGATGGNAHLHLGVFRTSNTNAHTLDAPELGYRMPFLANTNGSGNNQYNWNAIDPLGWAAPTGFDPWAVLYHDKTADNADTVYQGTGAWSVSLFKSGESPAYPYRLALP